MEGTPPDAPPLDLGPPSRQHLTGNLPPADQVPLPEPRRVETEEQPLPSPAELWKLGGDQ